MTEARANGPTATLLSDGRVLVTGGQGSTGPLASAELYEPSTGSWTATGSMIEARASHTATLLPNNKVLVAGGSGTGLASAELYDPITGSWTSTGSMIEARANHTATLLPNGKVLVAGGAGSFSDGDVSGPKPLASAELYDLSTGSWTVTASMNEVRFFHTATLLPNGKVLVAGNDNVTGPTAELYDPKNGSWTVTMSMNVARADTTATLLLDGRVLVAGGGGTLPSGSLGVLSSAELFDPGSGTWTAAGNMHGGRAENAATLLPNGKVLVAGGNSGSGVIGTASAELYDPGSGTWAAAGSMMAARGFPMATLLPNGRVLVAGGFNSTGDPTASAELYDPSSGS